ncbi:MAG TPA: TAXI family TRAP transporter solute-binding subunit [Candidatus Deferrimicrobiaceae bacterium]|nr:TAXI family TRAP transporter solute-binding subunit [Candidatus Deferrimicrobiaceae bacterium]
MHTRRSRTVVVSALILAVSLCIAVGAGAQEKLSFSIATGGTGGVWYPLGGAIGGVVGTYVPHTEATAEATTAAIDNMKLLVAGKVGMAFAYDYHVGWANEGKAPGIPGTPKIRLVMGFYEQPLHIVTTAGTGITSVMQLMGKRVSVGAPNSGTEEQASYVLKALGIDWNKDIKKEKLGATESVAALKDGKIDAFFWSGAIPTASIIDLASTPGLKMVLLPVSGEAATKIMSAIPVAFHKTVFPKGCYAGIDRDIETIGITAVLQVMDTFPADRLHQILTAIFDHKAELAAVWKGAAALTPEKAVGQVTPDALPYLHPGARKFFTDKGVVK